MDEDHKAFVAVRLGPHFVHSDRRRFAIIPDTSSGEILMDIEDGEPILLEGEPNYRLQYYWNERLAQMEGPRTSIERTEFLKESYQLRMEDKLLWPLGLLFDQTLVGRVDQSRFFNLISELNPSLAAVRSQFYDWPHLLGMKDHNRTSYAFAFWKIFVSMKMAMQGIETADDIQDVHINLLAKTFRPNGLWPDWLGEHTRRALRTFVTAIGNMRSEPAFGHAIGRLHFERKSRSVSAAVGRPHLGWVETAYARWVDSQHLMTQKGYRRALKFLLEVLAEFPVEVAGDPQKAFGRDVIVRLIDRAAVWSTPDLRMHALGRIFDFLTWYSDESRDDNGHPTVIATLTASDVARFRKQQPASSRMAETVSRPMPPRYHARLKEIISEDDFAWPKSLTHMSNGKPRLWFTWVDPKTGESRPVFSEVLPRLLMLLLDLPLRTIQARRLDSGEGDDERWDAATGTWMRNDSRKAGYWRKNKAHNCRRGAIRRIKSMGRSGEDITGLYINSNKTQDRNQLFDENSGYEIPWQHEDVLRNLDDMRRWQETYNPVRRPLPLDEVPNNIMKDDPSATVLAMQPDRFYLFRDPLNGGKRGNEAPPSYGALLQFFLDALAELERRLNLEDPDEPVTIITGRDPSGLPKQAIYSMHGMRSSTLSALHAEGVPIGILSKLVAGHATILMTLHYIKYEPAHVSEILTSAREKALTEQASSFRQTLSQSSFEQAAKMTARLSDDGLHQASGLYSEKSAWTAMDTGICPNGQTRCDVGGEPLLRRSNNGKDKSTYAPVPGGPRNCVRCRFFVTGLPFLIPLCAQSNSISARANSVSQRIQDREVELKSLKQQRHQHSSSGESIPEQLRRRIQVLEAEWDTDQERRDQLLADFHATVTLIEKIRLLGQTSNDDKLPMIISEDGLPDVSGRESTRFELTDAVVQMSRFFPSLASDDLERERDAFLDRILYQEGYVPFAMSPLSKEEKRKAADAMAALLIGELGAMEAENLLEGRGRSKNWVWPTASVGW